MVGVGLIGGSFALAQKAAGRVESVVGVGRGRANLDAAVALGVVDRAVVIDSDWTRELADADLVLLATPVAQFPALFAALAGRLPPDAVLTDAGSTKQNVIAAARSHLGAALPRFVPGHPIAGTEHTGAAAAIATLYRDRNVVLTPIRDRSGRGGQRSASTVCGAHAELERRRTTGSSPPFRICRICSRSRSSTCSRRVRTPTRSFGMRRAAFAISPGSRRARPKCGGTFRSPTATALLGEIGAYRAELDRIAAMVAANDGAALEAVFNRAAVARRAWGAQFDAGPGRVRRAARAVARASG